MAFGDEEAKMLVDLLDEGLGRTAAADKLGVTRNVVVGQIHRHRYGPGRELILDLAKKFPEATAREIAEATGRDQAPVILHGAGYGLDLGGAAIRGELVAKMRAKLIQEGAQ